MPPPRPPDRRLGLFDDADLVRTMQRSCRHPEVESDDMRLSIEIKRFREPALDGVQGAVQRPALLAVEPETDFGPADDRDRKPGRQLLDPRCDVADQQVGARAP